MAMGMTAAGELCEICTGIVVYCKWYVASDSKLMRFKNQSMKSDTLGIIYS